MAHRGGSLTSTKQSIARCYIEHLVQRLCGCGGREGEPTSGADRATRSTASASSHWQRGGCDAAIAAHRVLARCFVHRIYMMNCDISICISTLARTLPRDFTRIARVRRVTSCSSSRALTELQGLSSRHLEPCARHSYVYDWQGRYAVGWCSPARHHRHRHLLLRH